MRALLVGLGGIGSNVYLPQLEKLGYTVTTVDKHVSDADFDDVSLAQGVFDVAVICTPNFTHEPIARQIALRCLNVFIEKPGLPSAKAWQKLCSDFPNTRFIMCKNNLYRSSYGEFERVLDGSVTPTSIVINWLNEDRVPSPGSWFTNKETAWGGVALDLFPHLYCHLWKLAGFNADRVDAGKARMWSLENLSNTAYGAIDSKGVYNVCDYAEEHLDLNGMPVTIRAAWKCGVDDQVVRVYTEDEVFEWEFGLCPDDAYGSMIENAVLEDYEFHKELDTWIHTQLEIYHES
jgi:predicted dehydrogenase